MVKYKWLRYSLYFGAFLVFVAFTCNRLFFFSQGSSERIGSYIVYPFLVIQERIVTPIKKIIKKRVIFDILKQKNYELEVENKRLCAHVRELQASQAYINEIKELITFKKRYAYDNALLVRIMLKTTSSAEQSCLINAGLHAGVEPDMVAVYNNCIVGKVSRVYPWYSKIILLTDKRCKIAVSCLQTKARGIHEGVNASSKTCLTHVNHRELLQQGDEFFSSGEGIIFPQGFFVGTVSHSITDALFHYVDVAPAFNIQEIEYCYLIKKGLTT